MIIQMHQNHGTILVLNQKKYMIINKNKEKLYKILQTTMKKTCWMNNF